MSRRQRAPVVSSTPLLILFGLAWSVDAAVGQIDTTRYDALEWRMIGPFRGGRVTAVAGHADQPLIYYQGTTGGGVWKTVDAGLTWFPISDSTRMAGSIGAIAVAPTDPNVIYVGTGEAPPRGNVSPGNGLYKSTDAGKTWTESGLRQGGQITDIVVHPRDESLVYAAALGHIFGPNAERGVFRSRDGGRTWEKVLFRDENAGAIDLVMDPTNPRILYAGFWQVRRYPYQLVSGGPGSGLFKSTDGGDTWTELTRNEGMPEGVVGKVGVAVSPADNQRVWAIVEAEEGGVFRSDDGGETWRRVNSERRLRQRAWYYTRIYADPQDHETVYVLNTGFYRSVDGGATYSAIRVPHGDNHDLWIAPNDPRRMINSNDGGANVSFNGGESWTAQDNQPTAQMYHAYATADYPYMVCGGQQDNSTICVPSRTDGGGITTQDYLVGVGGCESGYVAQRPDDTNVFFAGCYGGQLDRYDRRTGQEQSVMVWPENPMGWGADSLTYRFQWTYPIIVSPHDPNALYVTSQHVHRSMDGGHSWATLSPDLTRNDKSKQGPSGGPITKDNTSVEYYGTIFTLAPSPLDAQVMWAGSDDGLLHVTRDGGASWQNVTPRDLAEWSLISIIDASPHAPGAAYVAATRYKLDDFMPYIYKTTDYGRSWQRITTGIPAGHFTRVVREDPVRRGLLYAGGEFGLYVSFDDGARWQSLQLNLPVTPIHDLIVKDTDLAIATHGRGFWILDDVTPLRQLTGAAVTAQRHLFQPRTTIRTGGGGFGGSRPGVAANPPGGIMVHYFVADTAGPEITLEFLEENGDRIARYGSRAREREQRLTVRPGMNRFVWNTRYPDATGFEGLIMWGGGTQGPRAAPGTYQVRMTVGDWTESRNVELVKDPRVPATLADLQQQFAFLIEIRDRLSDANGAVVRIRSVRTDIENVLRRVREAGDPAATSATAQTTGTSRPSGGTDSIQQLGKAITDALGAIEREIYQTQNRSNQDPLNFPIRLNNKIAYLARVVGSADTRPTESSRETFDALSSALQVQLDRLRAVLRDQVPGFNRLVAERNLPAVVVTEGG